jgi:NitT/TauT family transport system ATP-binding protein
MPTLKTSLCSKISSSRFGAADFLNIVGPGGCGKSTLLKCIAGLEQVNAKYILIGGKQIDGLPDRLGIVFQADTLADRRTVLDDALLVFTYDGGWTAI